jgi:protein involved in polysaccharide export with SLBB domain
MREPHRAARKMLLLALGIAALFAGCASSTNSQSMAVSVPVPPAADVEYAIQPGDTLGIEFYYHPDHNEKGVLVAYDGRIMLPLVGSVEVGGRTPSEVSRELEQRYSATLRDPRIAVTIEVVYQNLVWVGGEVKDPGFVRYRPGITAVQAVVAAGGPKDTGALEECLLLHRVGRDQYESSRIDLTKPIKQGDGETDRVLAPQDVIFVPKTAVAKANVFVKQYFVNMIPIRFTERIDRQTQSSGSNTDESGQKNQTKAPGATHHPSDTSSQSTPK